MKVELAMFLYLSVNHKTFPHNTRDAGLLEINVLKTPFLRLLVFY